MASPPGSPGSPSIASSDESTKSCHELSLDELVDFFVAAKRALDCQPILFEAKGLVDRARSLVEEESVLYSKIECVQTAINAQVDSLDSVRVGMSLIEDHIESEYRDVLHNLDISYTEVQSILTVLRNTPIEASLQPPGAEQKHLFDFIDNSTVTDLQASLRSCIDRHNQVRSILAESMDEYDSAATELLEAINQVPTAGEEHGIPSPVLSLFHDVEEHAKEIAQLFQSLVSHYDQCVTALRHTEGGSAAATEAIGEGQTEPDGLHAPLDPLTAEEREELLKILQKDASDVDDVVTEVRERGSEMSHLLAQIEAHLSYLRERQAALQNIYAMSSHISHGIKKQVDATNTYHRSWLDDVRPTLQIGVEEWDGQRDFYERFDLAYAQLLVEIGARRRRHEKAKRKAEEAQRELDRVFNEDKRAREQFTLAQGDFLPLDLWRGIKDEPRRYEVRAVASHHDPASDEDTKDNDYIAKSIPQLDRSVLERATARVHRKT